MNTSLLLEMLAYRRPAFSQTEEIFIEDFLTPLGVESDEFGNLHKRIGDSDVLWSCHTDTVHRREGNQDVVVEGAFAKLAPGSDSNCLGADCTTGVWLMHQMIMAGKPGLYIFHRAEERGGRGSGYIADHAPYLLDGINKAIAFDRFGTSSIITYQGYRCCSDTFARSLKAQLPGFELDEGGVFTDTANYTEVIAECTNLSVGYSQHHTSNETQNLAFAQHILGMILKLDVDSLDVCRDPSEGNWFSMTTPKAAPTPNRNLTELIKRNPEAVAGLLTLYGISYEELLEHVYATSGTLMGEYWQ